jgi:hypothetical protein
MTTICITYVIFLQRGADHISCNAFHSLQMRPPGHFPLLASRQFVESTCTMHMVTVMSYDHYAIMLDLVLSWKCLIQHSWKHLLSHFFYIGAFENLHMRCPCTCVHVVVAFVSRIIPLLSYATLTCVASMFRVHWLRPPRSEDRRSLLVEYHLHLCPSLKRPEHWVLWLWFCELSIYLKTDKSLYRVVFHTSRIHMWALIS